MIADFNSIKRKLHQAINVFLREEVKCRTPFLSHIGAHYVHEGDRTSYETVDKEKRNLKYQKAESAFTLNREQMNEIKFPQIVEKIQQSAEDMAGQMERVVFQSMNESPLELVYNQFLLFY